MKSRFKEGTSGNPKGRPPGSKNYDTVLRRLLEKRLPTDKKSRRLSRKELIVEALLENALAGDNAAIEFVFGLMQRFDVTKEPGRPKIIPTSPEAIEVINRVLGPGRESNSAIDAMKKLEALEERLRNFQDDRKG